MSVRRTALALAFCAALLVGCGEDDEPGIAESTQRPGGSAQTGASPDRSPTRASGDRPKVVDTVASGLAVPWGLDFLPDGRAVVTERDTARVLVITPPAGAGDGEVVEVGRVPETAPQGEAGLLDVAVSPDFERDHTLYFYVCTADDNEVVRAELDGRRPVHRRNRL